MATRYYSVPGEDAFDTVAWDPDLPSAKSPDESPEPVTIKPQPLAYTTVGSVVNTNSLPQLSAPNRIQREGARRPLMSLLQSIQPSSAQRRGPAPPLNMSNSMHYAQQFAARSTNPENVNPSFNASVPRDLFTIPIPARRSSAITNNGQGQGAAVIPQHSIPMLTQQEKDSLMTQFGAYPGIQATNGGSTSPIKQSAVMQLSKHQEFHIVKAVHDEESRTRTGNTQGPLQGLEKMQTLQRLAKFENPMQQHARNRLSEFSVARSQMQSANPLGELNRDFKFPPPGIGGQPSGPQSNPLLPSAQIFAAIDQPPARPPGYPQPLTAGPPGQRQAPTPGIMRAPIEHDNTLNTNGWEGAQWNNPMAVQQAVDPWVYQQPPILEEPPAGAVVAQLDRNGLYTSVKIVDTIPYTEAAKYYPQSFPANFDYFYVPVSFDTRCEMANAGTLPHAKQERVANEEQKRDNCFYYGQRRLWGMTVDDYMQELDMFTAVRPYTPKGAPLPPRKIFTEPVLPSRISREGMEKMSVGEAARPIFNAAFGTMISLLDKGIDSARDYNQFDDPKPEWVDPTPEAGKSLFGEGWSRTSMVSSGRVSRSSERSHRGSRN